MAEIADFLTDMVIHEILHSDEGDKDKHHEKKKRKTKKGHRKQVKTSNPPKKEEEQKILEEEKEKEFWEKIEEEEERSAPEVCRENKSEAKSFPEHYQANHGGPMNNEWFAKLKMSKSIQKAMCYSESLLMVTESGDTVGKMYCTVSESEWNGINCLSVHSGSSAAFQDGLECGTTVTGFVNSRFRILHEYIYEWAKIKDKIFERKTFLIQEKEMMHCRVITIRDKIVTEDRVFFLSKLECQNLITESGNILFQRVIIQQKKTGDLIVRTLTSKGIVVRCTYQFIGHGNEVVRGENIKVYGIRRTVFEEEGAKVWDSLFNYFGRLVLRCQPENETALVPLWFEAANTPEILDSNFGSRPPLLWACDLELYASYLTQKREKAGEYRTYLKDHPELRSLLSDFLQTALQQKPTNILAFASNYFEPWLPFHEQSTSQMEISNPDTLSTEITGSEDMYGEDMSGESGALNFKGHYAMTPLLEEDNVLLEENSDYYLQGKFQKKELEELTTVYKNSVAFNENQKMNI